MITRKLNNHEYAQAQVLIFDDGTVVLQSYDTQVINVDVNGWLQVNGLYSATTIKHIGWFMKEYYGLSYHTAKRAYKHKYIYNVFTGEAKTV